MELIVKPGASLEGLRLQMWRAIPVIAEVYFSYDIDCVVTCGTDSHEDKPGSFHNLGLAVDIRTKNIPIILKERIVAEVAHELNRMFTPCYQVVFESEGKPQEHIHIEYDATALNKW